MNPATLQCGHSFCMDCIDGYWNQEKKNGICSCPQCRCSFAVRPVLNKNAMLANIVTEFSLAQEMILDEGMEGEVGPQDKECDFCTVRKLKAVKSCLVCLASYCATHIQPHYVSAAFKRHKLVEVSASIEEKICSKHDKLLEVYCRTDDQCICLLCVMDDHKGHTTVSAAAERKERQKQVGKTKQMYQQSIQEKEKQLHQLRKDITELKTSGDAAVNQNEKAYTDIVLMADKRRCAVKELIQLQQNAAVGRAEALESRIQTEISELRKRQSELKQLSDSEDHVHFLKACQSLFNCPEVSLSTNIQLQTSFHFVVTAVSDMGGKLDNIMKVLEEISKTLQTDVDPMIRQEFCLYTCHINLDPNTAFENLMLSEGNSKVTWVKKPQSYPYHPERFTKYDQVLCSEGLSGACYWEVGWKGPRVEVAVCYKEAELEECGFGYNNHSWCISLSQSGCTFWHSGSKTKIMFPCSSTIGVFLNHKSGILGFYNVSDSGEMTLLHRIQTTFTQPLYPGFMVSRGSSVKIITPN